MLGAYDQTDNELFKGQMTDVRIYNRVLTDAEIKILATPLAPSDRISSLVAACQAEILPPATTWARTSAWPPSRICVPAARRR